MPYHNAVRIFRSLSLRHTLPASALTCLHSGVLGVCLSLALLDYAVAFDPSCVPLSTTPAALTETFTAVVAVYASGRATGTYRALPHAASQWRLGQGTFTLTGRGVVVGQLVVTAAHVVYPATVEMSLSQHLMVTSPVVAVQQTTVSVGAPLEAGGVPAEIVHLSHRFDLAILRPLRLTSLQTLPYATSATWWRESPAAASSLLRAGDCVVALLPQRDAAHTPIAGVETRAGQVVAPSAVSSATSVVAGLNPNIVTISTPMLPGDSGSPVMAFDAGVPRLVGVVTATRYPFESMSYISRIDPLLPLLEALQAAPPVATQVAQVQ